MPALSFNEADTRAKLIDPALHRARWVEQVVGAERAAESPAMLTRLQQTVINNGNVFEVLMDAVRCCSLGQITNALFEVGGQYRRSMQGRAAPIARLTRL